MTPEEQKEYIDKQIENLKTYVDINFQLDRKAVDQYSKTNDEWKLLHNGLQRKMEEDRSQYVTKDMLDKQGQILRGWALAIIGLVSFLVTLYEKFVA